MYNYNYLERIARNYEVCKSNKQNDKLNLDTKLLADGKWS